MPPSEIAATWNADEIQNAEVLADLEAWGQVKRMVAKLCAEIHNAGIIDRYLQHAERGTPAPKTLSESQFLPRRLYKIDVVKTVDKKKAVKSLQSSVSQVINSLAGF